LTWVVVPAAGSGSRFGGDTPKQYLSLRGRSVLQHTLERLGRHPRVSGLQVVCAADDGRWPGWTELDGKPVRRADGGASRAESVLAGLRALPESVGPQDWVLVHDAARPCLRADDLDRLLERGCAHPVGAILAAPVRDTLKRADGDAAIERSEPRERLWRALTPQLFRRAMLADALQAAITAKRPVTDEAMAIEQLGLKPLLVEGAEDNIKITTPADLAMAAFLLEVMGDS
jgi:2-C-methyl-D-erythritol 4-phosphate cytidylyltransferase